jgi:hypothetical protein
VHNRRLSRLECAKFAIARFQRLICCLWQEFSHGLQGLRTIVSGQSDQILRRGKSQLQLHMSDIAQRSFELAHYLTRRSAVGHPRLDFDWITVIC